MIDKVEELFNIISREFSLSANETMSLMKLHNETVAHIIRCSYIAEQFGDFLDLKREDIEVLILCSLYHDLGKFNIEPSILYKKEKISNKEFNLIKSHANYVCKNKNKAIQDSILYHHERPDGNGYKGKDYKLIHTFAKIISIIDTYDVMINKRCYKSRISSKREVIKEIKINLGKQFDLYYGKLFIEYLNKIQINIAI